MKVHECLAFAASASGLIRRGLSPNRRRIGRGQDVYAAYPVKKYL